MSEPSFVLVRLTSAGTIDPRPISPGAAARMDPEAFIAFACQVELEARRVLALQLPVDQTRDEIMGRRRP